MGLNNTIERIKSNAANIGSKMMTGKTIEEQVKKIFEKVKDNVK